MAAHEIIVINILVPVLLRNCTEEQIQNGRLHVILHDALHLDVIKFLSLDYHVRIQVLVLFPATPRLATLSCEFNEVAEVWGRISYLNQSVIGARLRSF